MRIGAKLESLFKTLSVNVILSIANKQRHLTEKELFKYQELEGTGAYGPLLQAPAEGLGGPLGHLPSGGSLF